MRPWTSLLERARRDTARGPVQSPFAIGQRLGCYGSRPARGGANAQAAQVQSARIESGPAASSSPRMTRPTLVVRLGVDWSRFTYERVDMELLGTVQRGAQRGALGRLPDGQHVQVNGDWMHALNSHQVGLAVKHAKRRQPSSPPRSPARQDHCAAVVVVRKKRRVALESPQHGL